jgi:phage virion morphogenesis protein
LDKALMALRERMSHFQPVMANIGRYLRRQTRINFERGGRPTKWKPSWRAKMQGGKTLMDTGRLALSMDWAATDDEAIVGTNVRYGRIHQLGGTIVPKTAKALTVPLCDLAKGKRARDFEGLFVIGGKEGKAPVLAMRQGEKVLPMFALMKKVTMQARPFLVWLSEFDVAILRKLSKWALEGQTEAGE